MMLLVDHRLGRAPIAKLVGKESKCLLSNNECQMPVGKEIVYHRSLMGRNVILVVGWRNGRETQATAVVMVLRLLLVEASKKRNHCDE